MQRGAANRKNRALRRGRLASAALVLALLLGVDPAACLAASPLDLDPGAAPEGSLEIRGTAH